MTPSRFNKATISDHGPPVSCRLGLLMQSWHFQIVVIGNRLPTWRTWTRSIPDGWRWGYGSGTGSFNIIVCTSFFFFFTIGRTPHTAPHHQCDCSTITIGEHLHCQLGPRWDHVITMLGPCWDHAGTVESPASVNPPQHHERSDTKLRSRFSSRRLCDCRDGRKHVWAVWAAPIWILATPQCEPWACELHGICIGHRIKTIPKMVQEKDEDIKGSEAKWRVDSVLIDASTHDVSCYLLRAYILC